VVYAASRKLPAASVLLLALTLYSAGLLVPSPAHGQQQGGSIDTPVPGPLTLDTAIAIALRVATPVQQARFASANAGTEVGRNFTNFLPSVGAAATRSVTAGNPLVGSRATVPWNTQFEGAGYQLSTSLNLLGALGSYPGVRAAQDVHHAYDLTLTRTRQSVVLDVSQVFLQTVLDSELVVITNQNYRVSQEQVVQLQELVRVGKRPPADLYQAQAQASANQSIFLDAVNRQYTDDIALLQRLHIDPQRTVPLATPVLDTTRLGPSYLDTATVARQALDRRPDLQSAKTAIDATRWGIRRAHNEDLPSLSIGFTLFSTARYFDRATQDGVNQILTPQEPLITQVGNQATTVFSIGLGYNLLDLFRSHFDVQEAQVAYQSAEVAEGDVRRQVTGDVARAIGEYGVAAQRMTSTAAGLDAAQAAFQLVTGRYNVGFATIVDLLTAQAALAQAQSLRAQAVVQMSLSKRALAYAMGFQPTDRLP
jgi:outer membrane protein